MFTLKYLQLNAAKFLKPDAYCIHDLLLMCMSGTHVQYTSAGAWCTILSITQIYDQNKPHPWPMVFYLSY